SSGTGSPSRSTARTVRDTSSRSLAQPTGVRTVVPSVPVAPSTPPTAPTAPGPSATVTSTDADPPAGTTTESAERVSAASAASPAESVTSLVSSSVTASSPVFVYVAGSVTVSPSCGHAKVPNETDGVAVTSCASAPGIVIRPAPSDQTPAPVGSADAMSAALSAGPSSSGRACLSTAAAPATCGVAMEVPSRAVCRSSTTSPSPVPAARAATMPAPGATTSGLSCASAPPPRLEYQVTVSSSSTAPTVSADAAMPGELTQPSPRSPSLPAATTNSVPYRAVSSSTATASGAGTS